MSQLVTVETPNGTCVITINGAPIVVTDYISEAVKPNMIYPHLTFNKRLREPVQKIHIRALVPLIAKLWEEGADKITFCKADMDMITKQKIEGKVIDIDFQLLMKGVRSERYD